MVKRLEVEHDAASIAAPRWVSISRAAKILQPASGSLEIAKERIWNALRAKEISLSESRLSPLHPINEFSQTKPCIDWFERGTEGIIVRGAQSTVENVSAWGDFFNDGGLLVDRMEIEGLDGPRTWEKATPERIEKTQRLCTNWIMPEAFAWIATRSYASVAQIGCDRPWHNFEGNERFAGQQVFEAANQRAAIGCLVRAVSLHHCRCEAMSDVKREAWEKCSCTTSAFNELWDAVSVGWLAAFDELRKAPIESAEIPGFQFDSAKFSLSAPRHPGAVTFRRTDVERIWPAQTSRSKRAGGRPAKYQWQSFIDEAVRRLWHEGGWHEGWTKAECEREMLQWCEANWSQSPSESTVRVRVNEAFTKFSLDKAGN